MNTARPNYRATEAVCQGCPVINNPAFLCRLPTNHVTLYPLWMYWLAGYPTHAPVTSSNWYYMYLSNSNSFIVLPFQYANAKQKTSYHWTKGKALNLAIDMYNYQGLTPLPLSSCGGELQRSFRQLIFWMHVLSNCKLVWSSISDFIHTLDEKKWLV